MIRTGALVAISTSGGKDSQAMTILLSRIVPRDQLIAVHAPLEDVEWPGTIEHIEATLPSGVPLILARVTSGKTLLDSIEERGRFPSPRVRWCTSSTKRGPIERELRHHLKAHPRFGGRIVSAMGMRAEESPARARKTAWKLSERNSRAGRTWFDWLPIHDLTEGQVFDVIREAGQAPHPAYAMGMSRLSCVFCIMASRADLRTAARLQPQLYARYCALERRIGHTLSPSGVALPDLTGISAQHPEFPGQSPLPSPARLAHPSHPHQANARTPPGGGAGRVPGQADGWPARPSPPRNPNPPWRTQ